MSSKSTDDRLHTEGEVRKGMLFLLPVVVSSLIGLVTLPIFLRFLTPEDYGYLALATAYAAVAVGIGQLGLYVGFEREFFSQTEDSFQVRLLTSVFAAVSSLFITIAILTWALRSWISSILLQNPALGGFLFVTFLAHATQTLRQFQLGFFRNRGDAVWFSRFSLVETVLWAALGLYFVVMLDLGVMGLPLGQLIASTLVAVAMFVQILRVAKPGWEAAALRKALRIGLPLTPRVLVGVASSQFDKVLLGFLASVGGVGIYSIGQRLAQTVFSFMTALENVYSPQVLKLMFEGRSNVASRIGSYLTPFAYWSVLLAVVVAIFAQEGLALIAPPEYGRSAPLVSILSVYYATMFFGKQKQLIFAEKTHLLPVLSTVLLVLNVALNIPMIRAFGAMGAAMGTTIAGVAYVWLTFVISQRHYPIRYESGPIIAIFGYLFLATATSLALGSLSFSLFQVLTIKIILFSGFVWLGWQLELITSDTLGLIRRALYRESRLPAHSSTSFRR